MGTSVSRDHLEVDVDAEMKEMYLALELSINRAGPR